MNVGNAMRLDLGYEELFEYVQILPPQLEYGKDDEGPRPLDPPFLWAPSALEASHRTKIAFSMFPFNLKTMSIFLMLYDSRRIGIRMTRDVHY